MSPPSRVVLDQTEIDAMIYLANMRYKINRKTSVEDFHNTTDRPFREVEIMGLCGEYAFAKMFNLFMDLSQNASTRAGEYDFITKSGVTIDVKTTTPDGAWSLRCPTEPKDPKCDFYVLMIDHSPIFVYAGYCTLKELLERPPKEGNKEGSPSYYWVPRDALHVDHNHKTPE